LSRDIAPVDLDSPIELNRYGYVHANPINYADPSGYEAAALPAPRTAAGGPLGEYALMALTIVRISPAVLAAGLAVRCVFTYITSVLMAANHDKAGLLQMEATVQRPCRIAILKYPRAATPNVAQHIEDAQQMGHPMLLIYNGPGNPLTALNRRKACPPSVRRQMAPLSCDEYPFASTAQGGAGASTRGVPPGEQDVQGGILSGFYGTINGGDPFAVVVP
jgi:hypothetical protein